MEMEHIRFEKEWMQFVLGGDMSGNTSGEYVQGQMPYIQNIQFIVKKTCSTQPLSKLPEYANGTHYMLAQTRSYARRVV